jgi:hypothetical protein
LVVAFAVAVVVAFVVVVVVAFVVVVACSLQKLTPTPALVILSVANGPLYWLLLLLLPTQTEEA